MARLRELNALWRYAHIVLSPHLDDAALSLGATIAAWTSRGERTLVLNVCSGLPSPLEELNPLADDLTKGSAHTWVRERRQEEIRATAILGADHHFGTALDAIFRHPDRYVSWETLFARPDRSDSLHRHAFGLVSLVASLGDRAKIYAPLGIGGHADHQIVCSAALRAVPRERAFFYEDVPYVFEAGARDKRLEELAALGFDFEPTGTAQRITATKLRAIAAYASQLEMLFDSPAAMRAAIRGQKQERLWRVATLPLLQRTTSAPAST